MSIDVNVYLHFSKDILSLLKLSGETIMSAISDFVAKQNAYNDQLKASLEGLKNDIKSLNDMINKLQNSPGQITAEDQALLDQVSDKSKSLVDNAAELDQLTPPEVPPAGGGQV